MRPHLLGAFFPEVHTKQMRPVFHWAPHHIHAHIFGKQYAIIDRERNYRKIANAFSVSDEVNIRACFYRFPRNSRINCMASCGESSTGLSFLNNNHSTAPLNKTNTTSR